MAAVCHPRTGARVGPHEVCRRVEKGKRRVKRVVLAAILLVVAGAVVATFASDPLYWKRRVLSSIYSPATLPSAYYEPAELIEGTEEGGSPPRVAPELEKLGPGSLQAAVDYA